MICKISRSFFIPLIATILKPNQSICVHLVIAGLVFPALLSGCLNAKTDNSGSISNKDTLSSAFADLVSYDSLRTEHTTNQERTEQSSPGGTIVLNAGQEIATSEKGQTIRKLGKDEASGFQQDRFVFKNTPLNLALRQIGRWYNLEVDENMPDRQLTGSLRRDLPFSQTLKACEIMSGVKLKVENRMIKRG